MPENRKIFRGIIFLNTAFVFSKRDIQYPMETIFYAPMAANCLTEAQALTICMTALPFFLSWDLRSVFPSMAMTCPRFNRQILCL